MRRILTWCVCVVAASGLASASPKGKNLGEAEKWLESEGLLKRNEKMWSDACGTKLTVEYDAKSFATMSLDEAQPVAMYCRDAFNALGGSVCNSPLGKEAVKQKVSAMSCRFSTTGTQVTLEGKTLIIHVDPKSRQMAGFVPGGTAWATAIKALL